MNCLSLRNNRLKFRASGKLPIILEEFIEYTPILIKKNQNMSTKFNWFDLETRGYEPNMPKNLPGHWMNCLQQFQVHGHGEAPIRGMCRAC